MDTRPGREYEELWFSLARLRWASLVLVPADRGTFVGEIANSLAKVGTRLRDTPVTAIVADAMDYDSVRTLTDLQPRLNEQRAWTSVEVVANPVPHVQGTEAPRTQPLREATLMPPLGRAIIAIRPIVEEPLGVAIAQAADAVVLCVELGTSRMKAARRTVELIGPERIIGAFLIR